MILAPVKVISFYVILRKFNTMSLSQRIEFKLLKRDISEHACLSNKLERLNLTNSHGQVKYLDRETFHSMMLYSYVLIIYYTKILDLAKFFRDEWSSLVGVMIISLPKPLVSCLIVEQAILKSQLHNAFPFKLDFPGDAFPFQKAFLVLRD